MNRMALEVKDYLYRMGWGFTPLLSTRGRTLSWTIERFLWELWSRISEREDYTRIHRHASFYRLLSFQPFDTQLLQVPTQPGRTKLNSEIHCNSYSLSDLIYTLSRLWMYVLLSYYLPLASLAIELHLAAPILTRCKPRFRQSLHNVFQVSVNQAPSAPCFAAPFRIFCLCNVFVSWPWFFFSSGSYRSLYKTMGYRYEGH